MTGFAKSQIHGSKCYLVSQQVNAVLNQQQRIVVCDPESFTLKALQSSTIKANVNKFVRDKKKCYTLDGVKTTRIEFTNDEFRSSNYTSNVPCMYHNIFEQFFDIICLVQGEKIYHLKPFAINNTNYTSVLYGVNNVFTIWVKQEAYYESYVKPLLFPSHINAKTAKKRHQIFSSLYINTQKVKPTEAHDVGRYVKRINKLLEIDEPFNRLCCDLAYKRGTFLNTANKILLVILNELYYRSDRSNYESYMIEHFEKYANDIPWQWGSLTNQYDNKHKNVNFAHLVPRFLYELYFNDAFRFIPGLIVSYASRVGPESLYELELMLVTSVAQLNQNGDESFYYRDGILCVRGRTVSVAHGKRPDTVDDQIDSFLRKEICLYVRNILFSLQKPAR